MHSATSYTNTIQTTKIGVNRSSIIWNVNFNSRIYLDLLICKCDIGKLPLIYLYKYIGIYESMKSIACCLLIDIRTMIIYYGIGIIEGFNFNLMLTVERPLSRKIMVSPADADC